MPRTSVLESPGCPPIRALTFDILGLIKVVEARGKQGGVAKVVDRWGDPDSSKSVLAASIHDRKFNPLLAVARKSGVIEVLNPVNGDLHVSLPNVSQADILPEDDPIAGLHLFKKRGSELSSRSCTLLTCSTTGHASLMSVDFSKSLGDSISSDTPKTWNVCGAGNITCSKVDEKEKYALFGGKGVEVNVWDIESCTKVWTAKSPAKNSLDIFTPTWFTSATFLNKDDHRKLVAGTNSHQVRLYDISAQRRPVISFDFRETPIRAVAEDIDGYTVYAGNGWGDLASFDMRTGKLLGCFLGKCSGSIRSIARHPQLPVIASCGLDSYLRVWDIKSRQLLSAVFLKQHLTNVVFDSQFSDEEFACAAAPTPLNESRELNEIPDENEEDSPPLKRKKTSKEYIGSKNKKSKKKVNEVVDGDGDEDEEQSLPVTQKKVYTEHQESKKSKSKKKSKKLKGKKTDA